MGVLARALIFVSLVLALLGTSRIVGLDFPLVGVPGALVGGLVASRKPRNPIGWFFLAGACIGGLQALAGTYAVYGLIVDPGSVPFASFSAWLTRTLQIVGPIFGFVLVPLYFPTGRPPTPRWRVITALFNPLRRRTQSFVDRRFYRSKYDARKTLVTLSTKLRGETDLGA